MKDEVGISDVLQNGLHWQIVDVRSPGEFSAGHIPGAVNIPLFTDEERARVGTLYKQCGPDAAMKEGLKISGGKMAYYLEKVKPLTSDPEKNILIHCWRGGKRSGAIHWLYNFTGIPSSRLKGGYKSYRHAVHSFFAANQFDLRILGGYTGSGKTEILKEISKLGHQAIDLEHLAHHKGSAFGSIGEEEQPTNEQFENDLHAAFASLDISKPIWIENESRNIGKVYMPEALWVKMRNARLYHVEVDREVRLDRALSYYASQKDIVLLKQAFEKIKKRLGGLEYQNALKALDEGELRTAASIALTYYDKSYTFQLQNWNAEKVTHITDCNDVRKAASKLILGP